MEGPRVPRDRKDQPPSVMITLIVALTALLLAACWGGVKIVEAVTG